MSFRKIEIWGMLQEIKETAKELSITSVATSGGASQGTRRLVHMYNQCRASIADPPDEFEELFPELDDDATLDEVWTCAAVLCRSLLPTQADSPSPTSPTPRSRHRRSVSDEEE